MFSEARNYILIPVAGCWVAAMAALFVHPAIWALFAMLVALFAYRSWTRTPS